MLQKTETVEKIHLNKLEIYSIGLKRILLKFTQSAQAVVMTGANVTELQFFFCFYNNYKSYSTNTWKELSGQKLAATKYVKQVAAEK